MSSEVREPVLNEEVQQTDAVVGQVDEVERVGNIQLTWRVVIWAVYIDSFPGHFLVDIEPEFD